MTLYSSVVQAQNLVPNWSFETYSACPSGPAQIANAIPWVGQTTNSTDYYNSCSPGFNVPKYPGGFQLAKNGSGYCGLWVTNPPGTDFREYAQVQLIDTLLLNKCYFIEFFVNLANHSRWGTNNLAANLAKTQYTTTGTGFVLNLPQHVTNNPNSIISDTLNWTKISGMYVAGGGEKYLTIGNFKDDANTDTLKVFPTGAGYGAYYLLDAVSVFSINPTGILPWQYRDTTVAIGDSVYIGNTMGGTFTSNWYTYGGTFIKNGSGIYVKPVTTTTYVVQFTVCGVPRSDTLKVSITGVGIEELRLQDEALRISPNPNSGIFDLDILDKEFVINNSEIKIINILGHEMKSLKLQSKKQQINLEEFESGIYYLQIIKDKNTVGVRKIIKIGS